MTVREYVYDLCENTDLDDKDDVIYTLRTLALKVVLLNDIFLEYEDKLKELLNYKDFVALTNKSAKYLFKSEVDALEEGEFKEFILNNFDDIINGK